MKTGTNNENLFVKKNKKKLGIEAGTNQSVHNVQITSRCGRWAQMGS